MINNFIPIVMWDGVDAAFVDIVKKINILKECGFEEIILISFDIEAKLKLLSDVTIFKDKKKHGSFISLKKGIRCLQEQNKLKNKEVIVIFGGVPFNKHVLNRLMQISLLSQTRTQIEAFVSVRLTKGKIKSRFKVSRDGYLSDNMQAVSGNEICGLMLLKHSSIKSLLAYETDKISNFIGWSVKNKKLIYGIINGCCGDAYQVR